MERNTRLIRHVTFASQQVRNKLCVISSTGDGTEIVAEAIGSFDGIFSKTAGNDTATTAIDNAQTC